MLKKHKNVILISCIALIGIILIILGSYNGKNEKNENFQYEEYTENLEKKIEKFLLSVDGINKVEVIVTLDTSSEQVYAQNQSNYDFITIDSKNGESPVNITEIYPTIRGVAIACTNGNDPNVKMEVTKLISSYLGISSNRIEIVEIK